MTASTDPTPWFDRLAQAAAGGTVSRQHPLHDHVARPAARQPDPTLPQELAAVVQEPVTRRTGLRVLAGAVFAFLAVGLPSATAAGAADCLAACRNGWYSGLKKVIVKTSLIAGVPGGLFGVAANMIYRFEVTCPTQCNQPPGPPAPPTTTTPSPPSTATCPPPSVACGVFCLDPNVYICCPSTSSAGYCELGEVCCIDHCALADVGC